MHQANRDRIGESYNPAPSTPIPRDSKAEEVAKVVLFPLSDDASYVTEDQWRVDGRANA